MGKHTSAASKEATWRELLARQLASGKSIAAFCRAEAISEGNFHAWRSRLRAGAANVAPLVPPPAAPFIDLGPVNGAAPIEAPRASSQKVAAPGIEIRIDLGDGIALTIARH